MTIKTLLNIYREKMNSSITLFWTNEVESLSKQSLRSPHSSAKGGGAVGCLLDKVASLSKQSLLENTTDLLHIIINKGIINTNSPIPKLMFKLVKNFF